MSSGPQLVRPASEMERNWAPLAIAAAIVISVLIGMLVFYARVKNSSPVTPVSTASDPYAVNLPISNLAMSESSSLSGGRVTYLDGHIANHGNRTVRGIAVQVLFRDAAHEVAGNETQSLRIIRTRVPYIDLEPVSASPLKPGDAEDFRLVFDAPAVPDQWDGAYPEIRIIHVETR